MSATPQALARHLAELNRVDRYILLMTYGEKMTCQEVARVLDWTEDRVRERLATLRVEARHQLRQQSSGLSQPKINA